MDTRQRKLRRRIVIEGCVGPGCRAVADRTILWESGGGMIRVFGSVDISLVARDASGRHACEHIVFMAARTRLGGMRALQREFGSRSVIKFRPRPLGRVVAEGAIQRESRCDVIRVRRAIEFLRMA